MTATEERRMNAEKIIKAAIPGADDSLCEHIIWGRTPFPCGAITAQSLYKAASRYARATKNKIRLCDFCDRVAEPDGWCCGSCRDALARVRGS